MNYDETIRPWLLTVAEPWGITQAHAYRWHDAVGKEKPERYFTYTPLRGERLDTAITDMSTADGTTVTHRAMQQWAFYIRIDLYNSYDGLSELARCVVAAEHYQPIMNNFKAHGVSFHDVFESPIDESTPYDDEILYHHSMIVEFYENPEYTIVETNGVVNQITTTIEAGSKDIQIDNPGGVSYP